MQEEAKYQSRIIWRGCWGVARGSLIKDPLDKSSIDFQEIPLL